MLSVENCLKDHSQKQMINGTISGGILYEISVRPVLNTFIHDLERERIACCPESDMGDLAIYYCLAIMLSFPFI